ncbi:MAG: hypothetical protein ACK57K_15415 [Chryseotalea sp.]|jgi:hypothetical protein
MKQEEKPLSPEQSLELISCIIRQTQGNVSSSSFYFLLWGWVITLCNVGMYILLKTEYADYAPMVWLLCIPAWITTMIYGNRQDKQRKVTTHLDKISMWLWIGIGITILPTWIFGEKLNWNINAVVLMPVGLATFLSGIIIKYKPLLAGGIVFWIAGFVCYLVAPNDQYLVGAIAMVLGYLVPGYGLRKLNM